jgi:ATP-dependent RNA helicase SUPV3L1/SUV3
MGPTNSGKTKNALDYLRKAKTGCYLSPLRLLAMEVQQILQESHKTDQGYFEDGVVCSVRTGPHK